MTPLDRRLPLCLAALLGTVLLAAAPPRPWAAEVGRLVKQLGDDEFEKEATTKRLKEIRDLALAALREAAAGLSTPPGDRRRVASPLR